MVSLDQFFSKKSTAKPAPAQDAGPTNLPTQDEQSLDRKALRLERRELLYAVVRESMARVGILSSSYKYKVLSLDSRGKQYLIMMDLPKEMAEHIDQLAEIEGIVIQNARMRHKIDVAAVYWRINELNKATTAVLRKPRPEIEAGLFAAPQLSEADADAFPRLSTPVTAADRKGRFEPIRPDEMKAFKQGQTSAVKKVASAQASKKGSAPNSEFPPTDFPPTDFEETRLDDEVARMPLSRTQYGDLI